jgi:6-phosphogluconolactonase (cycloisomerase 2 family)
MSDVVRRRQRPTVVAIAFVSLIGCGGGGGRGGGTSTVTIGGSVTGLTGSGLVLRDNGADNLSVAANGTFVFKTPIASSAPYDVTVAVQPTNKTQNCAVTNGIGKVTDAAVTNVSVSCKAIGRFAYALTDNDPTLGTNYGIWAFTIDPATGAFSMASDSPYAAGEFPSHVAAAPNTKFVYATGWDSALVPHIYAYAIDTTTGALAAVPGSPFAASSLGVFGQLSSGAIAIDPQNRFLYVLASSNVLAYAISPSEGSLAPISGSSFASGTQLDSIVIDPSGQFVYVADSGANEISAYAIDAATGALTSAPGSPYPAATSPKMITIDSTGRFVYVNTQPSNNISAFQINSSTGALSAVAGSPFATPSDYSGDPGPVAADPNSGLLFLESTGTADLAVVGIDSATGALTVLSGQSEIDLSPGGFGAEMQVDPSGKFAYILNSNDPAGGNIAGFFIDSTTGSFTRLADLVWQTDDSYQPISFAVTH